MVLLSHMGLSAASKRLLLAKTRPETYGKEAQGIKKTGTYKGKSNKPGGGGRFQQLVDKGMSPALAASIGRKKYGKKQFAQMAAAGRRRA